MPSVYAQAQEHSGTAVTADGSSQPSVAAQSPTPQKPLRESAESRSTNGKDDSHILGALLIYIKAQS